MRIKPPEVFYAKNTFKSSSMRQRSPKSLVREEDFEKVYYAKTISRKLSMQITPTEEISPKGRRFQEGLLYKEQGPEGLL